MALAQRFKSLAFVGSLACGVGGLAWAFYERYRHSVDMIMLNLALSAELSEDDQEHISKFMSTELLDLKQQRWSLDGEVLNYLESSNAPISARILRDYIATNNKRQDESERIVSEALSRVRIKRVEESGD